MKLAPTDNFRAAPWMVVSAVGFATTLTAVKHLGTDLPAPVMALFRSVFGLLFLLPFFARHGISILYTKRPGAHAFRVVFAGANVVLSYYAIVHLPMATAISLSFTRPLFVIIIGVIALGEVVRWRRGLATVIGFAGVLIMLGPTELTSNVAALAGLAAALTLSIAFSVVRQNAAAEGHLPSVCWYAIGTIFILGPLAIFYWETPTGIQWAYLLYIGLMASFSQFCMIKALTIGEATAMAPIDYLQIIVAAVAGYFLFEEIPTIWTAIGAVIIVASTLYIVFREARLKPNAPQPVLKE